MNDRKLQKAMDHDINCINFKGLMQYLQNSLGEEAVASVLDGLLSNEDYLVADKYEPGKLTPVSMSHVTDPAYWVSNEFSIKLLRNAKRVLPGVDPLFHAGEESVKQHLSKSLLFIVRLLSPKYLARHATSLNARFNRSKVVKLSKLTSDSAHFELSYRPGIRVTKDVCDWNRGIYSGIAKVAGAKNVSCQEMQCVLDGNDTCVFSLKWSKLSMVTRFARWFLRSFTKELWEAYEAAIRERDNLIQHLRESEERFRQLAELLPETIFEMDVNGSITFANRTAFEQFGYIPADLEKGLNAFDMITPVDRQKVIENTQRIFNGEALGLLEINALRKDGTIFPAMLNTSIIWGDEKPKGLRGIVMDISKSKKLETQLLHSQKMEAVGTLARGIAHDFNNLLAIMLGYTEMALYRTAEGTDQRRYLVAIDNAIKRAKDLTKQILTFSKQDELELRPVRIDQIVEEVFKLLRASMPATIDFQLNLSSDSLVMADPTQIHQVIMNICTNASHAMRGAGGVLSIELMDVHLDAATAAKIADLKKGAYVSLTISDTGHGMNPEVLARIFEPFFTTKDAGEGTGLGLAVVHGIVMGLGGSIVASSEPGKGAVFNVYFPVLEAKIGRESEQLNVSLPLGRERILVVEDEPMLADIGKIRLEALGYSVEKYTSSTEALERFSAQPEQFDLVITDMTMPEMTGDKLARRIMEIRPEIPVILCSGFNERAAETNAKEIGIKAFMLKPMKLEELAAMIRSVLEE